VASRTEAASTACHAPYLPHTLAQMSGLASLSIATMLAFHPYSAPTTAGYLHAAPAQPTGETQPGWEEVEAENAAENAATESEVPPPTIDPASVAPAPGPAPAIAKPEYKKGTGLLIGAGVAGGVAWILGLTRMGFVKQCTDQLQSSDDVPTGTAAVRTCSFKAGAANAVMAIVQIPANWASWGLAAAGGAARGRYDGVDQAWLNGKSKKTGAFIGAGAALIAVGVIGRVTAGVLVFRPYRNFANDLVDAGADTGKVDEAVDRFSGAVRGRLFGLQLSSAAIGAGAGLLAYGIAYRKNFDSETRRLQQVRIAPQLDFDARTGGSFTGISMSGRF
jgi:hypothetical protein